jgi:hypothetical protein
LNSIFVSGLTIISCCICFVVTGGSRLVYIYIVNFYRDRLGRHDENITNKRYIIPKGPSNMINPEKLATRRRQTKQKQNTKCVGHHYSQTNTNNINKTKRPPTGEKANRTSLYAEIVTDITT